MPHELWWPDAAIKGTEQHIMGSGQHRGRKGGDESEHLFTLKQGPGKLIWACACGETVSRMVAYER